MNPGKVKKAGQKIQSRSNLVTAKRRDVREHLASSSQQKDGQMKQHFTPGSHQNYSLPHIRFDLVSKEGMQ